MVGTCLQRTASASIAHSLPDVCNAMPAQVHTRKLKLDHDVTNDVLRQVARDLPGLSGLPRPLHAWLHVSVLNMCAAERPPCMGEGVGVQGPTSAELCVILKLHAVKVNGVVCRVTEEPSDCICCSRSLIETVCITSRNISIIQIFRIHVQALNWPTCLMRLRWRLSGGRAS